MRLLLTGPVPPHPGGGAISRGQLAAGFARAGHDVSILAPITEQALPEGDRFAVAHPELCVVRYQLDGFEKEPFRPPPASFLNQERHQIESRFPDLVSSFRPDVVVVGRETFARYVPELARRCGLPSVLLVRGSPTGHILLGEFPQEETDRLFSEFRKVDQMIAVSQHLADGLTARGFQNVVHIPNAIDVGEFVRRPPPAELRASLQIDPNQSVVLVPANLHQRKRPFDVLQSAELVLRNRPDVVYVMAGTGVLREQVEHFIEEKGMATNFRLTGWLDYPQLPGLMNLADVVILASETEGMARVCLEAMACERLLLASDIAPSRELVEDGVNGVLFPLGDVNELAARTLTALGDSEMRGRLGQRARKSVEGLSVDRIVPRYLAVFAAACGLRTC
jgi:glycosyltransferase involved in cell wall biosynthesis